MPPDDPRRAAIVAAARECIGTPWHHQQRRIHVGMDCIGLLTYCADAVGLEVMDQRRYSLREDGTALMQAIHSHGLIEILPASAAAGDLLVFRIGGVPHHVGIMTDDSHFVHVSSRGTKVCEEIPLSEHWAESLHSAWRVPE